MSQATPWKELKICCLVLALKCAVKDGQCSTLGWYKFPPSPGCFQEPKAFGEPELFGETQTYERVLYTKQCLCRAFLASFLPSSSHYFSPSPTSFPSLLFFSQTRKLGQFTPSGNLKGHLVYTNWGRSPENQPFLASFTFFLSPNSGKPRTKAQIGGDQDLAKF